MRKAPGGVALVTGQLSFTTDQMLARRCFVCED